MKHNTQKLLFVVDPWETLDLASDTTLRLIEEALEMGAECFVAENRSIGLERGTARAEVSRVSGILRPRTTENIHRSDASWEPLAGFHHIFYRTDPPVDLSYLLPLQILASVERIRGKKPTIHASTESLFYLNEKWAPAELGSLFPESLVSASLDRLSEFAAATGKVVLKPLYLAQSRGVEVLDGATIPSPLLRERLRVATENEKLPVILQKYLPGITKGETRLWFTAGKLIASVKKVPKEGESVIDMDQGGRIREAKLNATEKRGARKIGSFLKRHRILFAAVDLIDGKVTDFNHTSPGLLVAMEDLLGTNLARLALSPILRVSR